MPRTKRSTPSVTLAKPGSVALVPVTGDPQAWATTITAHVTDSVEAILAAGRELIAAKDALPHGQWERMFKSHADAVAEPIPVSARSGRMLMVVARDPLIADRKYASVLPPSWYTLHLLTRLPAPTLARALTDGTIRPDMAQRDVIALWPTKRRPLPESSPGRPGWGAWGDEAVGAASEDCTVLTATVTTGSEYMRAGAMCRVPSHSHLMPLECLWSTRAARLRAAQARLTEQIRTARRELRARKPQWRRRSGCTPDVWRVLWPNEDFPDELARAVDVLRRQAIEATIAALTAAAREVGRHAMVAPDDLPIPHPESDSARLLPINERQKISVGRCGALGCWERIESEGRCLRHRHDAAEAATAV